MSEPGFVDSSPSCGSSLSSAPDPIGLELVASPLARPEPRLHGGQRVRAEALDEAHRIALHEEHGAVFGTEELLLSTVATIRVSPVKTSSR
jgi:hypothetical protein